MPSVERGTVAVGLFAAAGHEAFLASLRSVVAHTDPDVPLLVSPPNRARPVVEELTRSGRVELVEGGANALAAAAGESDLALLDGTARVGGGWLGGLRAALPSDGTAATASALSYGGGVTGLGRGRATVPPDRSPEDLVDAVRRHADHRYPCISASLAACRLLTRAALDLAGPPDEEFDTRCSEHGFLHVAADSVLVLPLIDDDGTSPLRDDSTPPVARVLARAVRAMDGLSVTIDGRVLTALVAGTQVQTLELVAALHRLGTVSSLRVLVPHDLGHNARRALDELDGVELLSMHSFATASRTLVVHRPYQVSSPDDLLLLRRLGEHVVVTHQDLIGYDVASYHSDVAAWEAYRRLTAETLATADAVIAFTHHVATRLRAESLIGSDRLHVVPPGTDHQVHGLVAPPAPPPGADALADRRFLLCLGSDLRHKNRRFAIALVRALRATHGWNGALVLAGPSTVAGSSEAEEATELLTHPELADAVVALPSVDEAHKRWLYENAAAVLYPTLREGFGLVPFESARAGTPCLFAAQSALVEHLPAETAHLVPWSAERSAEAVAPLLGDDGRALRQIEQILAAGTELTWDRAATALAEIYDDVVSAPPRSTARLGWVMAEAEGVLHELLTPTARSLVGEGRLLPDDIQRTLAALARRPASRGALFRTLRLLRRTAVRGRD